MRILCSEWVPSEWEFKPSHVIHTISVHHLMSFVVERCVYKKSIKTCFTSNPCFQLKYNSIVLSILLSPVRKSPGLKYYLQARTVLSKYIGELWCERTIGDIFFFIGRTNIIDYGLLARNNILKWKRLDGLVSYKHILYLFTSQDINWWAGEVWIIAMFLSALWSLILMAPIHCRGSISEQVM